MGDNNNDNANGSRPRFEKLNSNNYQIWIHHVRDHLLAQNLDEVYEASEKEAEEEGSEIDYSGSAAARAAIEKKIKELWNFLRNSSTRSYTRRR